MIQNNKHFEIQLKDEVDERVLKKKCNQLNFDNPRFLACRHVDEEGNITLLAVKESVISELGLTKEMLESDPYAAQLKLYEKLLED